MVWGAGAGGCATAVSDIGPAGWAPAGVGLADEKALDRVPAGVIE